MDGEEENVGPFRLTSARTRRIASCMASALASSEKPRPVFMQKKQSKIMKRKTRQGKALEKKSARSFIDVLQEPNLESLPHVPTYLRTAVGPPSTSSRWHYGLVCGSSANYTCVRCGTRFCLCRYQVIHNDMCCLKFVA